MPVVRCFTSAPDQKFTVPTGTRLEAGGERPERLFQYEGKRSGR